MSYETRHFVQWPLWLKIEDTARQKQAYFRGVFPSVIQPGLALQRQQLWESSDYTPALIGYRKPNKAGCRPFFKGKEKFWKPMKKCSPPRMHRTKHRPQTRQSWPTTARTTTGNLSTDMSRSLDHEILIGLLDEVVCLHVGRCANVDWPANVSYWDLRVISTADGYRAGDETIPFGHVGSWSEQKILNAHKKSKMKKTRVLPTLKGRILRKKKLHLKTINRRKRSHCEDNCRHWHRRENETASINPFTPKSDQFQISPAASSEI